MKCLPPCPVETTLQLIGNKWKILIIRDLLGKTKRFNELLKSLNGVSTKVLTENLRNMEEDGLINRTVYAEIPPKVEYSLTDLGKSLEPVLKSLEAWGWDYKKLNGESDDSVLVLN